MSDRVLDIVRDSRLSLNYIPSGRQLPRTPPLTGVKKQLDFCDEDGISRYEEPQQSVETNTDDDDDDQNRTFDFNTFGTKSEPDDPNSMLKGMKGYQLTQIDLEFIEKMRVDKLIKKLQGDLKEVQKLLTKETMPLELVLASREKAQAELQMFPSCADVIEWVKVVLKMTLPSNALTDLDAKSLLDMVTEKNIQRAKEEKRVELTRVAKRVANKRKKEAQAKGQLEKHVAHEQVKIQGLMRHLSDLKSELLQEEEAYKALEMQINAQESPEITAKEEDAPEELQAAKRQATHRGKGRTKALESTEKLQDSTRSKLRYRRTSVKDEHGSKDTRETLKPKRKKTTTTARTPSQEVASTAQESVGAVRGRRKPRGAATPPLKNQSRAKAGEATARLAAGDAGEETQHAALRRSKRIASRTEMCS